MNEDDYYFLISRRLLEKIRYALRKDILDSNSECSDLGNIVENYIRELIKLEVGEQGIRYTLCKKIPEKKVIE